MGSRNWSSSRSFYRFDAPHQRHSGLQAVRQEEYRNWCITLEHCVTGMTIRRNRYNVRISETETTREEYLTGFGSQTTALAAARHRIDFLLDLAPTLRGRPPQVRRRA